MKILKKIIIGLVSLIVILVLVSYLLPGTCIVTRTAEINAPVETVYAQVSDFNNWNSWSPWYKKDKAMKQTISGTPGQGKHLMNWESEKVGNGSIEFDKVVENKSIDATLTMKEMNMQSAIMYRFEPTSNGTKVTWSDSLSLGYNPMMRWAGLFMDKMMGPDFDEGLKNIKEVTEKK